MLPSPPFLEIVFHNHRPLKKRELGNSAKESLNPTCNAAEDVYLGHKFGLNLEGFLFSSGDNVIHAQNL